MKFVRLTREVRVRGQQKSNTMLDKGKQRERAPGHIGGLEKKYGRIKKSQTYIFFAKMTRHRPKPLAGV